MGALTNKTILCVADKESLLDSRKQILESSGFSVLTASSSRDALTTLASQPVDAVVVDCAQPDVECEDVPFPIKQLKPRTPLVLVSPSPIVGDAVSKTVDVFLPTEPDPALLRSRLDSLIQLRNHSHPELDQKYVIFADNERRYLDCSDGVCELLGYPRMELIGMSIDDVSYVPERVSDLFSKFVTQGQQDGEYILRHKSGSPVLIRYRSYIFPDGCIAAVWEPIGGWRELYSAALVEVEPEKLPQRVETARIAIEARLRELTEHDQNSVAESRALQDAVAGLEILSREFTS
jgi:CheY-like chemotaxis protein